MSKADTWMPLYIGDYLKDTARLSTLQHGAYLLIIMDYWTNGPLPDDDFALSQVSRLSPESWQQARVALSRLFTIENGYWRHKRIDSELERASAFIAKQKANGMLGGRPKKTQQEPNNNPNITPSPSPSPSTSKPSSPASSPASEVKANGKVKSLAPAKPSRQKPEVDTELQAICKAVWHAYSDAYQNRYGVAPIRNAQINAKVKGFCQRIPASDAPHVAAWYVGHNGQRYGAGGHVFGLLLADAEKLRTEWATNRKITNSQTKLADQTEGRGQVWGALIAEAEERERNGQQAAA